MRTFLLTLVVVLPVFSGCSSTLLYQATGAYSEGSGEIIHQFDSITSCKDADVGNCTKIELSWKTERFCGIYKNADDAEADKQLRVGSSPSTNEGWVIVGHETRFMGDDEDYEPAVDGAADNGTDVLCGKFVPPTQLVNVRQQQTLELLISCKPVQQGIKLMPPVATPYPLKVAVVGEEKTWLGCNK
jgi:hypothetical protein